MQNTLIMWQSSKPLALIAINQREDLSIWSKILPVIGIETTADCEAETVSRIPLVLYNDDILRVDWLVRDYWTPMMPNLYTELLFADEAEARVKVILQSIATTEGDC